MNIVRIDFFFFFKYYLFTVGECKAQLLSGGHCRCGTEVLVDRLFVLLCVYHRDMVAIYIGMCAVICYVHYMTMSLTLMGMVVVRRGNALLNETCRRTCGDRWGWGEGPNGFEIFSNGGGGDVRGGVSMIGACSI